LGRNISNLPAAFTSQAQPTALSIRALSTILRPNLLNTLEHEQLTMDGSSFMTSDIQITRTTFFTTIAMGILYVFMKLAASRRFIYRLQKANLVSDYLLTLAQGIF